MSRRLAALSSPPDKSAEKTKVPQETRPVAQTPSTKLPEVSPPPPPLVSRPPVTKKETLKSPPVTPPVERRPSYAAVSSSTPCRPASRRSHFRPDYRASSAGLSKGSGAKDRTTFRGTKELGDPDWCHCADQEVPVSRRVRLVRARSGEDSRPVSPKLRNSGIRREHIEAAGRAATYQEV